MNKTLTLLIVAAVAVCLSNAAGASMIAEIDLPTSVDLPLEDGNATVNFNTGSPALMTDWTVDGTAQAFAQTFFLSVDGAAQQNVITADASPDSRLLDTNATGDDDRLDIQWTATDLTFRTSFILRGTPAGSGSSNLSELVTIVNTGNQTHTYRLFQYVDFDLFGTPGDDSAMVLDGSRVVQSDPTGTVGEVVTTPAPSAYELGLGTDATTLWDRLNGQTLVMLNGGGPISGDVSWAFQWDFELAPGEAFGLSKVKNVQVVPEPASMAMLGMGALLMVFRGRRRG